jgi:hypothetical protein
MDSSNLYDVFKGIDSFAWRTVIDGDYIKVANASQSIAASIQLPEPLVDTDEPFALKTADFKNILKSMDGDIEMQLVNDDAYIEVTDGDITTRIRIGDPRGARLPGDPRDFVGRSDIDSRLSIDFDELENHIGQGAKITDDKTVELETDGSSVHLSLSTKGTEYKTTIENESHAMPATSYYDTSLMKDAFTLVGDVTYAAMAEDMPIVVQSKHGDIDVVIMVAPKIQEA